MPIVDIVCVELELKDGLCVYGKVTPESERGGTEAHVGEGITEWSAHR